MDPFTLATGITGFLAIALDVGKILSDYISQYKSAPTDAQTLLEEITALSDVLKQLVKFLEEEEVKQDFHETSVLCRVVDLCKGKITSLRSTLVKLKKSGGFTDRLRWPFRKQECTDLALTLHHYTQTLQFSLTIANCELLSKTSKEVIAKLSDQRKRMDNISLLLSDVPAYMAETRATLDTLLSLLCKIDNMAMNVQEIKDGGQSIQQNMDAANMEKLLTWLSPLEPQKRHQAVQASRVKDTGNWLLQSEQFRYG
ncbi:hypothetical protein BDZ91DRAFT_313299 [Kalaharituber pfeilii]|nr:hypothetical protein BDZ91DRAFT_313299 [Kalaharituber pfeilii]